ncbi:MAG: hypothetical protein VW551_04415 [Euryarchaeota archaeon]|jgi:hypothetical protein
MKAIIAVLFLSMVSIGVSAEETEHNYKFKDNDWTYTFRHREGTYHTEIGKQVGPINVMYRYADLDGTIENRIKFTHKLYQYKNIKLSHRIEYRDFDNEESHWRYRFILDVKHQVADDVYLWAKVQPRWSMKDVRTSFDTRDQIGLQFVFGDVKVSPFVERGATEDYRHNYVLYGTYFEYKL